MNSEIRAKLSGILTQKSKRGGEYTLPWQQSNLPFAIREQIPGYESYHLEIGCGWGEFTRASAALEPQTLFVALEKKLGRVLSSSRAQKREHLMNIRYLVLDVAWFFDNVFSANTFDAITINFPDPWPKARHHKHRFVSPEFAAELRRIARKGGRLVFATDNYAYAQEATSVFETCAVWKNVNSPYCARSQITGRPVSFFEAIHRGEGAPIYFLEYEAI